MNDYVETIEVQTSLSKPRDITVKKEGVKFGRTEVTLLMTDRDGNEKNINELILPKDKEPWTIVQGEEFAMIGSDPLKHIIQIPEYAISVDGDFGHDYRPTESSLIDEAEHVEVHDFLLLDGAGYTLLHEVGHAWIDGEFSNSLDKAIDVRNKDIGKWTDKDCQIWKEVVIPMEERAWEKADELDMLLQREGVIIEPNWSEERKDEHKRFTLESYYSKLSEYERINR